MTDALTRFLKDETAATSIEYALIAAGISITIIVAVTALGTSLKGRYENVSAALPGS